MPWIEQAQLLQHKARNDAVVEEKAVVDLDLPGDVVGFHVQQCCEKCIKAVLSLNELPFRRTHDLAELADLLKSSGFVLPTVVDSSDTWFPFAAEYRYAEWEADIAIDRTIAMQCVRDVIEWCSSEFMRASVPEK